MPELRFTVLGPVRAWRGDTELDLGTPQQQAVLAVLLLAEGRQVSLDALVDALWGQEPPRTAAGTVRTYVSRLRHCLETSKVATRVVESAGDGYALPLRSAVLDLRAFLDRMRDAQAARNAGQADRAAVLLCEALGLWRGAALAGIAGEYAQSQRTRLAELQTAAIEERLALDIELGSHVAAATELQALLASHPLRERLSELLMLALYRSGRQADALAVFDATRRRLVQDLGIDPGPALGEMHQRILQADESLISMAGRSGGPVPAPAARMLERSRPHWLDGAAFVDLSAVTDPRLVADAIAAALGLVVQGQQRPLDALARSLAGRHVIVLDNFE